MLREKDADLSDLEDDSENTLGQKRVKNHQKLVYNNILKVMLAQMKKS